MFSKPLSLFSPRIPWIIPSRSVASLYRAFSVWPGRRFRHAVIAEVTIVEPLVLPALSWHIISAPAIAAENMRMAMARYERQQLILLALITMPRRQDDDED